VSDEPASAGELLRAARVAAGLSQAELAARAGVTQSVISVYESGHRQPSLPTLAAMISATGHQLDIAVRRPTPDRTRLTGPLGRRLRRRRTALMAAAANHGVRISGVFGSVARGEDRADSDIDLLVSLPAGMGLFELGRVTEELQELLGARVDLVPAADLKPGVRANVLADLVPL
jgi:predicted nucleotidyltransferase